MGLRCVSVVVSCCEQGVFAQVSVVRQARQLGLTGWVACALDNSLHVEVEGPEPILKQFISLLQTFSTGGHERPVAVRWMTYQGKYSDFRWRQDAQDVPR